MRISERHRYWVANRRTEKARSDNVFNLNTLSTQKRINDLHDDPIGHARVLKTRQRLANIQNFKQNVDFTKGFLDVTETAISSIGDRLSRAHELAIAMANDSYDASSRQATAKELNEVINQVIQLGNSQFNGKYVFSGFRSQTPSLDREGNFLGDDGAIFLQVGPEHFKKINVSGRSFFEASEEERQSGHFNMLDSLQILYEGMQSNDKSMISKAIEELAYQLDKTLSVQATVGALWSSLEEATQRLDFEETSKQATISDLEDADVYKATSDFKRTESVLQSTLLASNKLLQPSLLNFMQ